MRKVSHYTKMIYKRWRFEGGVIANSLLQGGGGAPRPPSYLHPVEGHTESDWGIPALGGNAGVREGQEHR